MSDLASHRLGLRKRELNGSDNGILSEATLANLNWAETRFTDRDVISTPAFAHYAALDLARGDFGIVALSDDWVGVAWVLFLPPQEPGYGFVEPGIGEVSVSVKQSARRCGLGRELMTDAVEMARHRGHRRLSLSVEAGNPAAHLYRDLGFVDVTASRLPGTLLLSW